MNSLIPHLHRQSIACKQGDLARLSRHFAEIVSSHKLLATQDILPKLTGRHIALPLDRITIGLSVEIVDLMVIGHVILNALLKDKYAESATKSSTSHVHQITEESSSQPACQFAEDDTQEIFDEYIFTVGQSRPQTLIRDSGSTANIIDSPTYDAMRDSAQLPVNSS